MVTDETRPAPIGRELGCRRIAHQQTAEVVDEVVVAAIDRLTVEQEWAIGLADQLGEQGRTVRLHPHSAIADVYPERTRAPDDVVFFGQRYRSLPEDTDA